MEENTEIEEQMKIALRASNVAGKRQAERLVKEKFASLDAAEAMVRKALGDGMFQTAHALHRQSASLPVLEMDLENLIETMQNLEFMGVLDSHMRADFGLHRVASLHVEGGVSEDVKNDLIGVELHEYYLDSSEWYSVLMEMVTDHRRWFDEQNGVVDLGQQRDYFHRMADHIREGVIHSMERLTAIDIEQAWGETGIVRLVGPIANRAARLFQEYHNTTMSSSFAHKRYGDAFTKEAIDRDDRDRRGEKQSTARPALLCCILCFASIETLQSH